MSEVAAAEDMMGLVLAKGRCEERIFAFERVVAPETGTRASIQWGTN
jgi:hypothetical protein